MSRFNSAMLQTYRELAAVLVREEEQQPSNSRSP